MTECTQSTTINKTFYPLRIQQGVASMKDYIKRVPCPSDSIHQPNPEAEAIPLFSLQGAVSGMVRKNSYKLKWTCNSHLNHILVRGL